MFLAGVSSDSFACPWWLESLNNYTDAPPDKWLYARMRINGTGATVTIQVKVPRRGGSGIDNVPD